MLFCVKALQPRKIKENKEVSCGVKSNRHIFPFYICTVRK